jgi:inosine-uridine nucleoside N-ribohydrolase
MRNPVRILFVCVLVQIAVFASCAQNQPAALPSSGKPQLALLDTDIGDDIDDAFALSLLLKSPEVKLLGITTAYGDTELRARLLDRYLTAVGRTDIPIAVGVRTAQTNIFTQATYARRQPDRKYPDGIDFLLRQIRLHPGEVTLIAIGPLNNIHAAIDKDPATFRKLKRVVIMGGSVHRGYGPSGTPPQVEWNTSRDPAGLRALLASGVSVFVLPLDSTQISLPQVDQDRVFSYGSAETDQLTLLYYQWRALNDWHGASPTLFDPVAAAYAFKPDICTMRPVRLDVDDKGMTVPEDGAPNAQVCLKSDEKGFLELLLGRITPTAAPVMP